MSPIVVATDAGLACAKTLGNPEGPTALLCELVGTQLAAWLGLPTFSSAILELPDWGLNYGKGCKSLPGPALLTSWEIGRAWSGEPNDLDLVDNLSDLAGLIVLDTWTRNVDRYRKSPAPTRRNLRNVFFGERGARKGRYRVFAMDHSACFRGDAELSAQHLRIDHVQDATLYGDFPAFLPCIDREHLHPFVDRLRLFGQSDAERSFHQAPREWCGNPQLLGRLRDFCVQRAAFVSGFVEDSLGEICPWHPVLPIFPKGN